MPNKLRGSKRPPAKRKGVLILDDLGRVVHKELAISSALLEKIGQFAPHLLALLEGPQADPLALPLACKTTDDLIQLLEFGWFASEVATMWNVDRGQLSHWIAADNQRVARAKLARKAQAEMWDRIAFAIGLFAPSDRVEMARAKLLMDHCKWRSSMYSPDDYVKRLAVKNVTGEKDGRELTTAQLQVIARGGKLPGDF
jgi:hypothetical protein